MIYIVDYKTNLADKHTVGLNVIDFSGTDSTESTLIGGATLQTILDCKLQNNIVIDGFTITSILQKTRTGSFHSLKIDGPVTNITV